VTLYNYSCLAKYVVKSLTGIVDFWFGYEHGCTCSTQYKFAPAHTLHIFGGAIKADAEKKTEVLFGWILASFDFSIHYTKEPFLSLFSNGFTGFVD